MPWLAYFFAGAFLANAVPHLVNGMSGRPFPTPFASPPGRGLSSPVINVLWGAFNLAVGIGLVCYFGAFNIRNLYDAGSLGAGALFVAVMGARHFGKP